MLLQDIFGDLPLVSNTDLQLRRLRTGRVYVSHTQGLLPLEDRSDDAKAKATHARRLRAEFLQRWCAAADPTQDTAVMSSFIQKQRGSDGWVNV